MSFLQLSNREPNDPKVVCLSNPANHGHPALATITRERCVSNGLRDKMLVYIYIGSIRVAFQFEWLLLGHMGLSDRTHLHEEVLCQILMTYTCHEL